MKKTIKSRVFYTNANDIIILELHQTKQGLKTFLELKEGKFECLDPELLILEMFISQMNEEQIYLGEL
jgi:hypothetical protein